MQPQFGLVGAVDWNIYPISRTPAIKRAQKLSYNTINISTCALSLDELFISFRYKQYKKLCIEYINKVPTH